MAPPKLSSIIYLLFFASSFAATRHAHQHLRPRHVHARKPLTPVVTLPVPPDLTIETINPTITSGNKVMQDIEKIQEGLSELPEDLLALITDLEARLQAVESALESLEAPSSVSIPHGPGPEILPSSSMMPNIASGGPTPTASSNDDSSTTTTTSTSTRSHTVTWHEPIPVNVTTRYHMNATSVHPTAHSPTGLVTTHIGAFVRPTTLQRQALPAPTAGYIFNPNASDNLAVYFGTTPTSTSGGLAALCNRREVDIVVLSFVFSFFGPGGYPSIKFTSGCSGPSNAQINAGATGLSDCSAMAAEILSCQSAGKKVLLSLGGYVANTTFSSNNEAVQFADTLWDLFGAGSGGDSDLRPFGAEVSVDGFDIDNENHNTAHYEVFANALRGAFGDDSSKDWYLSAAPQCPMPDESIPLGALALVDFVWVQFYNNPSCNLGSTGFQSSFAAWDQSLADVQSTPGKPKLYIGAPAFEGAGTGYVAGLDLRMLVEEAQALDDAGTLGGMMLWDGSEATVNVDEEGTDFLVHAKGAVQ